MFSNAHSFFGRTLLACGLIGLWASPSIRAEDAPSRTTRPSSHSAGSEAKDQAKNGDDAETDANLPTIDVLEGLRTGKLAAEAEGLGDGRVTLSITNRTKSKLRVVLPPGLVASGLTGQFGGMGGFGGGMGMMGGGMGGGMGMMGGGMGMMGGGMGGGMGMMGGGMGGMGGGMMGGRGGMMGGRGGMMGGTMPASMGMMMLGRLIMTLIGDRDSWDQRSLMMGMMGGMGMGGMGMMGGGMGGGMMGGGMGGGFRSVPPTGLPFTTLKPHQTRNLPTAVVSLDGPNVEEKPVVPQKGEKLRIRSIDQCTKDARTQAALKRLAEEKAPQTVSQLVLWNVANGLGWPEIRELSRLWANPHEIALARQFVERLDKEGSAASKSDSGLLYWELKADGSEHRALVGAFGKLLETYPVLGLTARAGLPQTPQGPAVGCRAKLGGGSEAKADVEVYATDGGETGWTPVGKFSLTLADESKPELRAAKLVDAIAAGMLDKLVRAKLDKGPRVNGKLSYKVKILNGSPLILNGVALGNPDESAKVPPAAVSGMCLPPRKTLTLPATAEMVDRLKLKDGVHIIAVDLSGL